MNSIKKDLGLTAFRSAMDYPVELDRLLDLRHGSTVAQLEQALTVCGKRVDVDLRELEAAA